VKKELHTLSIEQTTHQESIERSCLRLILFDKRILFHKKDLACGTFFAQKSFIIL